MPRNCFVIMPFDASFNGIWEEVIRPTIVEHGDTCKRADDIFSPGLVMNEILSSIQEADYLIADLTGRNPNVYYELGVAHSLKKPVILLTRQVSDVPFDLKHHRLIQYEDTISGAASLKAVLKRYLSNLSP